MGTQNDKFRKRYEEDSGGLTRDESRHQDTGGGLEFQKLDASVQQDALTFEAIADKVLPVDDSSDLALDDFGLGQILAKQKNERAAKTLEEAQALVSSGQIRTALAKTEQALVEDNTCWEAWALKGKCLSALGHHEAALRVFSHARGHVVEPELRMLILKLEAECVHSATQTLETQILDLVGKNQVTEALALANRGLRSQPSNVVFLYHLANLQWLGGNRDLAEKTLQEAYRHVGQANVDFIADLERKIEFGSHRSTVEAARQALRRKDPATALQQLDACAALQSNEHYQGLRDYAERKRSTFGQFLKSRAPASPPALLQQTLRWVLAEEIREADDALRAADYPRARVAMERAKVLEPDCGAVLYKYAQALSLPYLQGAKNRAVLDNKTAQQDLKTAEELASQASIDPGFEELAQRLAKNIRQFRSRLT